MKEAVKIYPEVKIFRLSEEGMSDFWERRPGDNFLLAMDVGNVASNANEGIILVNTTRVPERFERYAVEHEKTEIAIERGEIDPREPRSTVLSLGLRGYMVDEAQARSIYQEYLLAHEEGVLDELHEHNERYYDNFLAGKFPDGSRPVFNWRVDIEARRKVKKMVESGVRL